MAVLYSNDFESTAHLGQPANITDGVGGNVLVLDKPTFAAVPVVRGNRSFAAADVGDTAYYDANTAMVNQAVRSAERVASLSHRMGHVLRNVPGSQNGYQTSWDASGGNARANISVFSAGTLSTDSSAYDVPVAVNDVLHMESSIVGNLIECRIWTNSNPRPSSPTVSVSKTIYASGAAAIRKAAGSGAYAAVDDLVITDAAGGEDFFYPPGGVFGGAVALDGVTLSGTFQGVAAGAFSGAVALDGVTLSGSFGTNPGTLVSEPLRTNNGTLLASTALAFVAIYDDTTSELVLRRTGLSTDASGIFTVTDPAIVDGIHYRVDWETSGGHRRMPRKLAA
jgi:hypothetical protein